VIWVLMAKPDEVDLVEVLVVCFCQQPPPVVEGTSGEIRVGQQTDAAMFDHKRCVVQELQH